jgi:hypothetical protein
MQLVECEAMPRFFFSKVTPLGAATDCVGDECQDLSEAKQRAREAASDLVSAQLEAGEAPSGWIEVEDEQHRPKFMLPLRSVAS